ncbi:MAG TPA: MBL fold metallo-hydrolase [Bryobacteraceae bacterium]|jgi:glyoxylase-like metal-dependent hydrolase (beta-lactamase superfamily II)
MTKQESIKVGAYNCWFLSDGEFDYPGNTLLPEQGDPPPIVPVPYTSVLVDTGPVRILIDTGAGGLGPKTGKLMQSLAAAGFAPEDIHTVVASHAHPDHIASLDQFPDAAIVMMQREFEFWTAPNTIAKLEAGDLYGLGPLEHLMASCVREHVLPARERMRLLNQPTELASGVLVFGAPGHTPGHAAVLISSGREQLLYAGDAIIHPAQFEHPDWISSFDVLHNETVETRRKLLDRAAADRSLLAAFHLPGAVGLAEVHNSQFHWTPVSLTEV